MTFAVIFDMDGVLLDSLSIIWNGHSHALARYNLSIDQEFIRSHLGTSVKDLITEWKTMYAVDIDHKLFTEESWSVQSELLKLVSPNPGVVDLLKDLYQNNVPCAVGTGSQRLRTEFILDALDLRRYFSSIVTATDIPDHKPDPA